MADPRQIFLSRDDVKHLTGTADRAKQCRCLTENRIPYTKDVLGRPVVTVAAVEGTGRKADREEKQSYVPSVLRAA